MTDDGPFIALEDQTADPAPPEAQPPDPELEPTPAAAAPETVAEPGEVAVAPEEDEDGDLEDKAVPDRLTNERMVPLHEVAKLRQKSRTRKVALETLSAQVKILETEAARAKELEDTARQWQAYAQSLQGRQPVAAEGPDPQAAERQQAQEQARRTRAERIAKRFDLYKPDGTLDVDRGLEHLTEQEQLAREQAEQMVRPLRTETAQSKSQSNRAALSAHLAQKGTPVDTGLFDQLWSHLTPELTANQEVAAVAAAAALGWPLLFGKQAPAQVQAAVAAAAPPVQPARSPVVVTEPISQRVVNAPRLTGAAARAAKEMGLTAEQVNKRYGNVGTEPWTVLADDVEG